MKKYKSHPYADLFPMMTSVELEALAEDIEANGLQHPVVLYNGEILDGRNRFKACELKGVEPQFVEFSGDDAGALSRVISLNVQRRDLSAGQRAIVAAKTWTAANPNVNGAGRKNSSDKTISFDDVAKQFKCGKASVVQARDLLTEAKDLASQVESCALTLSKAYEQLAERRKEAARKAKDAEKVAEFKDAIDAGDISIEEAIAKAMEAEREQQQIATSQSDARRTYLKRLAEVVSHVETHMEHADEADAGWFWQDGPGQFEHGLTSDRISHAADLLRLAADHAPKGAKRGKK